MSQAVSVSSVAGMSFLSSIVAGSFRQSWIAVNGTNMYEMLRLLDQIDRAALADFLAARPSVINVVNIDRIAFAADVVLNRRVPATSSSDRRTDVADARTFLAHRAPLRIPRDPTGTLPNPKPGAPGPSEADYQAGATLLGAEIAAIKAVADVESGGRTGFAAEDV